MKRIYIIALLLASYFSNAQNSMLNADFWKKNPDLNTVKTEVSKGNNPAEANKANHDVVSMAINSGAPFETIVYLLEQPGNGIDKTTHDGRLYIHWAANKGNIELINYLIKKSSDVNRTDDKGATPLAFAASNGQVNPKVYETFFNAGIDPKYKNAAGATFMHMAVAYDNNLELTNYLISKGLKLSDLDSNKNTIFDYAARTGNVEILNQLQEKGIKPTPKALIFASEGTRSKANDLDFYVYLVETLKLDPKTTGANGENVLHNISKKKGQIDILNYFLQKGVDVNHTNNDGNTVLMEAVKGGDIEVVQKLMSKTKDINKRNKDGMSALSIAVNNGTSEVVSILMDKNADLNVRDNAGNIITYYLIQSYRPVRGNEKNEFDAKVEVLTKAGVDFNELQKNGNTLLHLAVAKNDVKLLEKLEKFNIEVNAVNEEEMTALHKAALIAKDEKVMRYLIDHGADVKMKTEFDETAYDLASENEVLKEANISIEFLK